MLELHVANSKVLPELLNSRSSSSTSISFPSLAISFGCIATLGPMLDSKYDLKNDPSSYACKVFAEMPDKKIDMEVEHPVINDSANSASHMFDEIFQTISAFKGEYGDLIMFDNSCLALPCLPSIFSCTQLMGRSIFYYFREFGHANLPLSLYRFPADQFGFSFPFDPGSSLLPVFLGVANYYSRMGVDDFKELIRIITCHINSISNAHCILPQFPFDPGANLFIISPGGCLQVFTLQLEASNWDLAICSMSMALIELTAKLSVFPWRKTLFVLLVAMSRYYDDDLWTPFDSADTLQLQRLISLRFDPMRGANAISSCFLVSRVIMSEAELDNYGQLCFSLLLLIVRRKCTNPSWDEHILVCIWNLSKLVVSINDTKNVDTPFVSQHEAAYSRNCVGWVIDMSLHRDITSFLIPLANKEYIVTKGYIAPKGHTKLLVSVISHIYDVEIMLFESLYLLKAEGWSLPVIIWSTVLLIGKVVRELPTPASNLLMLVCIASLIAPMRILTMISILYYLNLEDKVLIGAEGIVMNGPRPVLTKQPKNWIKWLCVGSGLINRDLESKIGL
ncbi:hypothetical protein KY290_017512 [Solanum tuberosum]|uniref:Uncharacterized protein n=1 Tax=Solanum tuberosum TaxID=4113 RepID=A0ABQ7VCZ7_SOLTU|nr:hypothetical protein KY290_017512 [Solanum tuberosum]